MRHYEPAVRTRLTALILLIALATGNSAAPPAPRSPNLAHQLESLRLAIHDLMQTYPQSYPRGPDFLCRVAALERRARAGEQGLQAELAQLRNDALLANPLLDFDRLLLLKRKRGQLGLPTNHQCNTALKQTGYDNEIALLSPVRPGGALKRFFRPEGGFFVGEMDLHFDADKLLFTMPNGRSWQIHEIDLDGGQPRRVSPEDQGVDNFDGCYLPDGRIVFASTANVTGVPCWHGKERACSLYLMNGDGKGMRQLCFDQDLDLHPSVLPTGQVIFSRWDYTGIMHVYLRPLMVMNPDGTLQRSVYGSNSYYPNALFFPRGIAGAPNKVVAILSGYHGVNRMGELVVLDTAKGWFGADGITHRIGHRGEPIIPVIRDDLVSGSWPKFLHPYPLSGKYFLAAVWPDRKSPWGVYLVDVFDNLVPLAVDPQFDFFEPILVKKTPKPPLIPDRVDLARRDAEVYLHNVYAGPGLKGVPHGEVNKLRLLAYHYGYPGLAGPNKIGRAGPWDAMRILGTVPVHEDGSAFFRVPACTPISVQPLDREGKALALMRSWYTALPGERASCVGCHEEPKETPLARTDLAARRGPVDIEPWCGPARGFDFEREVQPVLDKYCVGCHNGQARDDKKQVPDLRARRFAVRYQGLPLSALGASRLEPELRQRHDKFPPCAPGHKLQGDRRMLYTPAYDVLNPLIRRVNIEDYVGLHVPCEYHADTSELIQMLRKGHHNVRLDAEAWDRLITWIDLNGPCHGTWTDIVHVPGGADRRRQELALKYGGAREDPEERPPGQRPAVEPIIPEPLPKRERQAPAVPGWPFGPAEAQRRQRAGGPWEKTIDLGNGVTLKLVRIPAGEFLMGSADGDTDEQPQTRVRIARDFWLSTCEITNEQFRQHEPKHFSGYFMKRSLSNDGPGIDMDGPKQPVVRVSWQQAMDYCRWLERRTGLPFTLPTEAQWEYACRSGSVGPFSLGGGDFSRHANLADQSLGRIYTVTGGVVVLQEIPCDKDHDDGSIVTAEVGRYQPNAWGLFDMHGNAAEWTRSTYRPYPYRAEDGRNTAEPTGRKVVRGGSFHDRPHRACAAFRLDYPAWQKVHNVGFRVACEIMMRDK